MPVKKLLSAIFLIACAIASIGLPILVQQLLHKPRLAHSAQAWWLGAEYLGEEGVIRQRTAYDCGIACLQMALRARGVTATHEALREIVGVTEAGSTMLGLKRAAEAYGVPVSAWLLTPQDLFKIPLPALAFVDGNHFVVIEAVARDGHVQVLDPARGRLRYPNRVFNGRWRGQTLLFGEPLP